MSDQSERDRALGRWRSSPTSNYVVYPTRDPQVVRVVGEATGASFTFSRDSAGKGVSHYALEASRYFNAHPLDGDARSAVWYSATEGQVWMISTAYRQIPFIGLPYIDDVGILRFAATHVMTGIPADALISGEMLTVRTPAEEEALR